MKLNKPFTFHALPMHACPTLQFYCRFLFVSSYVLWWVGGCHSAEYFPSLTRIKNLSFLHVNLNVVNLNVVHYNLSYGKHVWFPSTSPSQVAIRFREYERGGVRPSSINRSQLPAHFDSSIDIFIFYYFFPSIFSSLVALLVDFELILNVWKGAKLDLYMGTIWCNVKTSWLLVIKLGDIVQTSTFKHGLRAVQGCVLYALFSFIYSNNDRQFKSLLWSFGNYYFPLLVHARN